MAGNQVVYEIKVDGTSQALGEFAKIESALANTSKKFTGMSVSDAFKDKGTFAAYGPKPEDVAKIKQTTEEIAEHGKRSARDVAGGFSMAFRQIAGDIDVIAGPKAAGLARSFSDAFGLIESITTKGALGPLAAVSTAIGVIGMGMRKWEEEEIAVKDAQIARIEKTTKAMELSKAFIDAYVTGLKSINKELSVQSLHDQKAEIDARKLFETKLRTDLMIAKARKEQLKQERQDTTEADRDIQEARVAHAKFAEETKTKEVQYNADRRKLTAKDETRAILDAQREAEEKEKARKEALLKYYEQFADKSKEHMITPGTVLAKIVEDFAQQEVAANAKRIDSYVKANTTIVAEDKVTRAQLTAGWIQWAKDDLAIWQQRFDQILKAEESASAAETAGEVARLTRMSQNTATTTEQKIDAARRIMEIQNKQTENDHANFARLEQRKMRFDADYRSTGEKLIAEDNRRTQAIVNNRKAEMKAEEERLREATSSFNQYRQALQAVHAEEQYGAGVNIAYGASTMVMNAMMQPLIATLQTYGSINRENWRDLLAFTEDSRDAFAAQVQQALWSLAMQAGQKSLFEVGEQYREQALAIGSAATGNFVGASLHMASASQHGVASALYAGIAGVSGGASIGVGMQRGEGGLFGLSKQEKEEKESKEKSGGGFGRQRIYQDTPFGRVYKDIGDDSASDSSGPSSRSLSSKEESKTVVVNFNYSSGSINAQDRDAAAATVSQAAREARRDGFMRRRMER